MWPNLFPSDRSTLPTLAERLRGKRRRRRHGWAPFSFLAALCTAVAAHATSVTPPSFPELVAEAQVIAQGTVTQVTSRWVDGPEGRMIKTFVDFSVEKAIKGNPGATMTLEFLGGTVGPDTLQVSGMPAFKLGEQEILFVQNNGIQFCPLVRFMHGRYRVRADVAAHRQFVARDDDSPLTSVADVQLLIGETAGTGPSARAAALSPGDFESQIASEVAHQRTATRTLP